MANYIFTEAQRFRQFWIWIILIGTTAVNLIGIFSSGLKSEPILYLSILLLILGLVILLFSTLKLETRIDSHRLSFRLYPLIGNKTYLLEEIQSLELIRFTPLWNIGGWGIPYNFDHWAYTVGGNTGILVITKKEKFLLGTKQPHEAQLAINPFKKAKQTHHAS